MLPDYSILNRLIISLTLSLSLSLFFPFVPASALLSNRGLSKVLVRFGIDADESAEAGKSC